MSVVIRFTDTVDIPVGEPCAVTAGEATTQSLFVGVVRTEAIILSATTLPGDVADGSKVEVRFLFEGNPYGFEATLMKRYEKPSPLVVVSYPDRFQSLSVRSSERVNTFIKGALLTTAGVTVEGTLLNISEGGGLFQMEEAALELYDNVTLTLSLPEGKTVENLPCEVRHVETSQGKISIGLKVDDRSAAGYNEFFAYYNLISGHFSVPKNVHSIYPL